MKIADKAGFVDSKFSYREIDNCDLQKALQEFDNAPWAKDPNDEAEFTGDLTFLIGRYHIGIILSKDLVNYDIEVCMPNPKKFLGIFKTTKFFTFNKASKSQAQEYIRKFFEASYDEQHYYFAQQKKLGL